MPVSTLFEKAFSLAVARCRGFYRKIVIFVMFNRFR
nr:MAG TPA: hypothetical protein [Caudoviricetes sp.]